MENLDIILCLSFIIVIFSYLLFHYIRDKMDERKYKNSDAFKKTRSEFIKKIEETKKKKQ